MRYAICFGPADLADELPAPGWYLWSRTRARRSALATCARRGFRSRSSTTSGTPSVGCARSRIAPAELSQVQQGGAHVDGCAEV